MFTDHFFQKRVQPPPKTRFTHMDGRTDIQTDGDYIKRVVHGPPGDHTLKNAALTGNSGTQPNTNSRWEQTPICKALQRREIFQNTNGTRKQDFITRKLFSTFYGNQNEEIVAAPFGLDLTPCARTLAQSGFQDWPNPSPPNTHTH